jgi:hypothetical protein
MMESKGTFGALVRDDSPNTTRELCTARGIGKPVIMAIVRELGYRKFCVTCLPKMLIVEHKRDRKKTSVQNFSSALRKTEMPYCQSS